MNKLSFYQWYKREILATMFVWGENLKEAISHVKENNVKYLYEEYLKY